MKRLQVWSSPFCWITTYAHVSQTQSHIHRESIKNKTPNFCPYLCQILTNFQYSFTDTLSRKFATKSWLQLPPHLKGIARLPCEILVSKIEPTKGKATVSCFFDSRCIWLCVWDTCAYVVIQQNGLDQNQTCNLLITESDVLTTTPPHQASRINSDYCKTLYFRSLHLNFAILECRNFAAF